jgi:hypothetical protein
LVDVRLEGVSGRRAIGRQSAQGCHPVRQADPEPTLTSHVNDVVCDSELERHIARELEADERVQSYVKNDHLFREVPYRFNGRSCRHIPDFLVRPESGRHLLLLLLLLLLLEGNGRQTSKDDAKAIATQRWIAAVNGDGRFGTRSYAVVRAKAEVRSVIDAALTVTPPS